MSDEILKVVNIQKFYGTRGNVTKAINDISFTVEKGEYVAIMGASGSGKTTLLNCISTIDNVTSGNILIGNEDITKFKEKKLSKFRREELGFIFQDFNLLDTLNAYENIALALTICKVDPSTIDNKVKDVAVKLNITDILYKFPYEISGGQKQRVAAARAIVTNPKMILADEPTGALDSKSAKMLLQSLVHLNEQLNATIMMVTHDAFSASYAKRIMFIKDGRIFNELIRGKDSRKEFFNRIIEVVTLLGGDQRDVF
ncbi:MULTISPECIES: ABC transporter ATP-binding protein [Clostridium]|uniref:ABC transporter ATP-binding protein n=1 Tax=Clostridium cibarium TaxID=2762247 RepID=A0ABR8PW91_9CLOT|nr:MULTISPECIES: ABC transporter ATP-binding protein [Clostridium]MBD7912420.1 ABC transporter ATP-binding protein [Clostridium cibarium]